MKTVEEGVQFIKGQYGHGDEIPYDGFDNFLEISGAPWIERQNLRIKYAKRLNTLLRKGIPWGDDYLYLSLWVHERGKSFVLMPLSMVMLKESQRTYTSVATQLDEMGCEYARALGRESYTSRIDRREIKFRGERPLLSTSEVQQLERHMDVLEAIAPLLETAERAKNNAAKCLAHLLGPQLEYKPDGGAA